VKWTKLANLNSKLLFIKEILQLVSLLENRQSLTSWKFIVDVPCHGLVGTKFNHPSPSSCREGSKPSTAGATHSQKSSDTKRHQNRSCAHTLTDRSAYIYIYIYIASNGLGGVTIYIYMGGSPNRQQWLRGASSSFFRVSTLNHYAIQWMEVAQRYLASFKWTLVSGAHACPVENHSVGTYMCWLKALRVSFLNHLVDL